MSERFAAFDPDTLSPEAKGVYDRIMRERGYLPGPYRFWLASPDFADRVEPVEDFLRHGVALDERQVEIVVLVAARYWKSQYVWASHADAAAKTGVEPAVIEAIRTNDEPVFGRAKDSACYTLSRALLVSRGVDDSVWAMTRELLGERRVNELLGLLGLYTAVCLTMIAYRVPAKGGGPDPLE
ncbi:MAG: carboxymuconolactone decarboxylase family protein [Gammaproteobacteria bacterium]|nr:carboxymuconolactone decarboxylase family protein [Gammaproteobacteria bacterium]